MSTKNAQETEDLIVKLLKKLERKGKNIQTFLWKLMDQFEDEQYDEKNEEKNINNRKITLLYNHTAKHVCKVGHKIFATEQKHLSIEPCILCGHKNNNNTTNKITANKNQILEFLNNYNTQQISFGPQQNEKAEIAGWLTDGDATKWPLHYAAISGDTVKIKQLCKNKNKNIEIDQKMTTWAGRLPITAAARYGQLESVIELLKNGANIMPPPDKGNGTPYKIAVYWKHKSLKTFFQAYIKYLYNFDINDDTNVECYDCYIYDSHFNKHLINGTMVNYVYCKNCTLENKNKVEQTQTNNSIIERRIIKTIKDNASISVDTLCKMKDVKALHTILKEITVCGSPHGYWLWLLDIDNFKSINSHLTHAVADTKLQALGQVLKKLELSSWKEWKDNGYNGLNKVYAFRQGGDEFALVTFCNYQKRAVLQQLYDTLRNNIHQIRLENMKTMKHITVSIGVCHAHARFAGNFEEMMKKADEAAEKVKQSGKDSIAIYATTKNKICKNFNEF